MNERIEQEEAIGKVIVHSGLTADLARQIGVAAKRFACRATIVKGRSSVEATQLCDLLLLGVQRGEPVTLCCNGREARAGYEALAAILQGERSAEAT